MGNSLSTRFEWSEAAGGNHKPAMTKEGLPQLQTSVGNQDILYDVVTMTEQLASGYAAEAKAEFRSAIVWNSHTIPSAFSSHSSSNLWLVKEPSKTHKGGVTSLALRSDGQPIFSMELGENGYKAKVVTFEYLHKFLEVAGDYKLTELQAMIQNARDPINTIFGVSGESGKALVESFDAFNNEADVKKKEQYGKLYKLLLVINSFDLQLMSKAVKGVSKAKFLDISKVTEELEMLKAFCGPETEHALVKIDWDLDFTFANGFKAPPWRQIYGELSYLTVQCHDKDAFIITASKKGYFVNKGYVTDASGIVNLDYDATSEIYDSLVEVLRHSSEHFASHIDKQGYIYNRANRDTGLTALAAEAHDVEEIQGSDAKADRADESHNRRAEKDSKRPNKDRKKAKSSTKQQAAHHSAEPSLKWRALALKDDSSAKERRGKPLDKKKSDPAKKDTKRRMQRADSFEDDEFELSDSDAEYSEEESSTEKRQDGSEMPNEYYQIQKLVKYLRSGNQTATIIAICSLRDFDLKNEFNQLAIRDVGGLETIVNLLDTDDAKCRIGALQILKDTSQNVAIRSAIADLDGMQPLVELLRDSDENLKCLAAETIAHCAKNARNRRSVRRYGGIRKLVKLLRAKLGTSEETFAISGALALETCSKSSKNKEAIQNAGAIPLLANLLHSTNEKLLIPVVGILQECATEESYRIAIRSSGMIRFLVENVLSQNQGLQTHCASAIFKCAEEDETCVLVRQYNGILPLVNLLDSVGNKDLLVAATGAVWKCAQNVENVIAFTKVGTIKKLVSLMENQPEEVLVNVVGALGACAQTSEGRQNIKESGGITPLVNLLTGTNQALLVNVTKAVGASALDSDCMAIIDKLDGVRLLWSLLKSSNHMVQASAAWAISPCIEHAKDAGEMVRSFVGGLELIVSLLKSDHPEVLASVCAAIANIAKDEENLAVITDHGVVPMLGKLTNTRNDKLRKHLAEAIARCCHWGNNRVAFGAASAVAPLVKYLKSPDAEVHRCTARALHQLSMDPDNCISMHEHGVVQLLLGMVGSPSEDLQEAAAGTIGNIRRLALASAKDK